MANTTHTEFAPGQLEIPAPVTDRRSTYAGELSRAQSDLAAAEARAAELALTVERQRREIDLLQQPITDPTDDRLRAIGERG